MPNSENKTKPISKPGPLIKEIYGFVKEGVRDKISVFIIISFPKVQRNLNHSIL